MNRLGMLFILTLVCGPALAQTVQIAGDNGAPLKMSNGGVPMDLKGLLAGEDQTNDVIKAEAQYSLCIDDADIVCKDSAGFVHSVWCFEEDGAPTAGTVRLLNATAAGAAETTEVWGKDITTAVGSGTDGKVLDVVMGTGIVIDFTTTADVKCGVSYR